MKKHEIILIALLFTSLIYAQSTEKSRSTNELTEFEELEIGQEIRSGDTSVKFLEVISDSRCPEDVTCIWQGEAKVLLGITVDKAYFEKQISFSGGLEQALKFGNLEIIIGYLKPYPKSAKKASSKDYCLGIEFIKDS